MTSGWVLAYVREVEIEGDEYSILCSAGSKENRVGGACKTLGADGLDIDPQIAQYRLCPLRHVLVELQP